MPDFNCSVFTAKIVEFSGTYPEIYLAGTRNLPLRGIVSVYSENNMFRTFTIVFVTEFLQFSGGEHSSVPRI